MRTIDLETWPRREHFKLFGGFDHPHFGMCANVDLTAFYPVVKQRVLSITVAIVYVIARAANAIPEFRYRIRGEDVIEHEVVHPSGTILTDGDLFCFCTFEYMEDFSAFAAGAAEKIAKVKAHLTLEDDPGRDDLLFMTAIPWVSFTGFMHPMQLHPADSIPRFAWGKFFKEGASLKMPLGAQAHHALMDGLHMGRYYELVQDYMHSPDNVL
jgi:chloramphenicol O-acetyltransferase type A